MDDNQVLFDFDGYNPKKINNKIKSGFSTVMRNAASLVAVMCIIVLIGVSFFEVSLIAYFDWSVAADAALTMVLYLTMMFAMQSNGVRAGKQDIDYVTAREKYIRTRDVIIDNGSPLLDEFCDQYVIKELESARRSLLSRTPVRYDIWKEHFEGMTIGQVRNLPRKFRHTSDGREKEIILDKKTKGVIVYVNKLNEVTLTSDMLLLDNVLHYRREGLATPADRVLKAKTGANVVVTLALAVFSVAIAYRLITEPSLDTAIYCAIKLFWMVYRGIRGYVSGYITYAQAGANYHNVQVIRLSQYQAWLRERGAGTAAQSEAKQVCT